MKEIAAALVFLYIFAGLVVLSVTVALCKAAFAWVKRKPPGELPDDWQPDREAERERSMRGGR